MDIGKIEEKIDLVAAGSTAIKMDLGGIQFKEMSELFQFAKLMAVAGAAVPYHLRGNPGACLAICTRALRFGFDPFSLAEHSYSMKKSTKGDNGWEDVETIAYDSFVIHAIIEAHAPKTGRLRIAFAGEGDDRRCIVSATVPGEAEPLTLESPRLGDLKNARGTNDKGVLKGSPLWLSNPDQQLAYHTRRDFCRRYFPETLLGWYDKEEFDEEKRAERAKDVTPKPQIADRLKGNKGRGFDAKHVEKETAPASAGGKSPAEGEKAGEQLVISEKSEPESTGGVLPAGYSIEVPDAYALGQEAKRQGKPMDVPTELAGDTFAAHRDAFADGYNSEQVAA